MAGAGEVTQAPIAPHGNGPVHFVSDDTGVTFEIYPIRHQEPECDSIVLCI
jgi:hypothetical protein